jgi:carboxyl-terminal processing protease
MKNAISHKMKHLFFILTAVILTSCEEALIGPAIPNDPITNFEEMWNGYDQYYGLFNVKQVNWSSVYTEYRPKINDQTSDEELKSIFHDMIDPLDDNHTYIITSENEPRIESGIFDTLKVQTDFSLDLIPSYVSDFTHYGAAIDYGKLEGNIGYIHFGDFIPTQKYFGDAIDKIFAELGNIEGMVVDIRDNPGGNDAAAQYVAGRFAAERKLYMTVRKKNGPGPNDFTQAIPWHVEPTGGTRFTKPVILLTSRWTQSAGETFTLAMQELSNVTQLGDYTSGAFSDNISRELPNGWFYFMSIGDYRASDGKSYEGIGVQPDTLMVNTREEILSGKDLVLERAISLL